MSAIPQQFGALTPGVQNMTATGTTAATAAQIYTKYSIFTTVAVGAYAQLPCSNASAVELIVMARGGNDLLVIPDSGGQIEGAGVDVPFTVPDGSNAIFVCFDAVTRSGRQWWVTLSPYPIFGTLDITGQLASSLGSNITTDYNQTAGSAGNVRWANFNNVLVPAVDTTKIFQNFISILTFNGPGKAGNELNCIVGDFIMSAVQTSTSLVNPIESRVDNNGALNLVESFDAFYNNTATGTATNVSGLNGAFTQSNPTAGAVTTYSLVNQNPMGGGGSLPTNYLFLRGADASAYSAFLGPIAIGQLGRPSGAQQLLVKTPDSLSTSVSFAVVNSNNTNVLVTTNDGVTNSPKFNSSYTNGASATTTSWFGHTATLTNANATPGAVTTYAGFDMEAMQGGGSLPTNYLFLRNNDANAYSGLLGAVSIGSIGAPTANTMLQVRGLGHAGSTFPFIVQDDQPVNLMALNDRASLTVGGNGNLGQVGYGGSTSGFIYIRSGSVTGTGSYLLQDLGGAGNLETLVGRATTDTLTNKTLIDFKDGDTVASTSPTSVASSTVLTNVTGLAVALSASASYRVTGYIPATVNGTPGAQLALGTSDTLTIGSMSFMAQLWNGATITAAGIASALGSPAFSAAVAGTYIRFEGVVRTTVAGTLTVQIAQNTSDLTATVALANAYLTARRIFA